jgi:hypothetical protein
MGFPSSSWFCISRRGFGSAAIATLAAIAAPTLHAARPADITAPDVDVVLERVRAEVELLRYHMGKPENAQAPPAVDDVQPHEAFLQAQNLFRKANRLGRELVGAPRATAPVAPPASDIVLANIYDPLEAALEQILQIKDQLGITAEVAPAKRRAARDLTSIYRGTVQTNRQLNLMSENNFTARDVFQEISLAITYAGGILSAYPETAVIPQSPPFEAGKSPDEVYRELSECLRLNRRIAQSVQFKLLRYDPRDFRRSEALPSDVYDMATLLVSYIASVASRLDAPEIYPEIAEPEYIFPAHAYQHARVLREQLTQIAELVESGAVKSAD